MSRGVAALLAGVLSVLLAGAFGGTSATTQALVQSQAGLSRGAGLKANAAGLPENWLERFNYYREAAGLPPVTEDIVYSQDLAKHANYMLLNPDDIWHGETPGRPGYTPEGAQAAAESNLLSAGPNITAAAAIDVWMDSVHHRYGMLHHDLASTGFAMACDSQSCGIGLNVLRGLEPGVNPMPEGVVYPGEDQQEVNDDVVISWQFDWYPTVVLNDASLRSVDGEPVEMNTSSPKLDDYFNVVALTASGPLSPGTTYTAAITVTLSERQLSRAWSFVTQPTGVAISGPEEGTTDKEYTYTAITTHSSALRPITYTWQASGQGPVTHVAGPSDYVSFAWSTPATQTITVTAEYGENLVSDIHSTVIRHAIWLPLVMRDV